jgi:hypothetical protein
MGDDLPAVPPTVRVKLVGGACDGASVEVFADEACKSRIMIARRASADVWDPRYVTLVYERQDDGHYHYARTET